MQAVCQINCATSDIITSGGTNELITSYPVPLA